MCSFLIVSTIAEDISWNNTKILLLATIIFGLLHFSFEIRHFIHRPMSYISSPWNWFAQKIFSFLIILSILILAFAHSFHLLLRPTTKYSYNQPSSTNDSNNPWNLVPTYDIVSSNGTIEGSSVIEAPSNNTNLFSTFGTSILAVYFMLTGDTNAVSSWGLTTNWALSIFLVLFSFFTTIYLLNLFIGLLSMAIVETNNEESFLQLRGEILSEIELFWMLPYQRRKTNWFPNILYLFYLLFD
ncbi:hypothetical protein C2G38_576697 [Gigaspora rosea]|uniref:Ion transport domain-containing protein n=1 Tax=Gigaspora rosea TaxID=44941 RepID=A0A397UEX1_9GLOM|nr:hypothetical protein C2G38_576697 [Gigaspora rosea]